MRLRPGPSRLRRGGGSVTGRAAIAAGPASPTPSCARKIARHPDPLPDSGPPGHGFPVILRPARAMCRRPIHQLCRGLVADRAVWANFVAVSAPGLAFSDRVVGVYGPVRVQALGLELAVQAFDEGIVRGLSRSAGAEGNAVRTGPEIGLLEGEPTALIDADRLATAMPSASLPGRADHLRYRCGPAESRQRWRINGSWP